MKIPHIQRITKANQGGFTLIELLVVIGILAILLAITLIAINPSKHFQDTRNAQRSSDVSAILNGIYEYEASNSGSEPSAVQYTTSTAVPVGMHAVVTDAGGGVSVVGSAVTLTVASGNDINDNTTYVTVSGCTDSNNNGTFPVASGTDTTVVWTNAAGVDSDTGCQIDDWSGMVNLCSEIVPTFLAELPTDPDTTATGSYVTGGATPCDVATTAYDTGYEILKSNGRFTVSAPSAEGGATISVTR